MDTVGKNKKKYIRNQLNENKIHDQMTMIEFNDTFTVTGKNPLTSIGL